MNKFYKKDQDPIKNIWIHKGKKKEIDNILQLINKKETDIKDILNKGVNKILSIDPGKELAVNIEIWRKGFCPENVYFSRLKLNGSGDKNFDYNEVIDIFDSLYDLWKDSDFIIIESQINYFMIRLSQHLITYFIMKGMPFIIEIASTLKSKLLIPRNNLVKKDIKKWSVACVLGLAKYSRGENIINMLNSVPGSRLHDIGDSILQIIAVYIHLGLQNICINEYNLILENGFKWFQEYDYLMRSQKNIKKRIELFLKAI